MPETIDPDARYLLYLHNRFLEDAAPGDRHPTFGMYEYQAILDALAERRFTVIAERREPAADPAEWASRVTHQVRSLEAAGVPPERISVVGFSKGGAIAVLASSELADDRVNFVFVAACGGWTASVADLEPHGRLLSIREASDDLADSCEPLFTRAAAASEAREIELHLGGGHGAFFRPRDEWIEPVVAWAGGGG
jgi:dienelactone hydrolase